MFASQYVDEALREGHHQKDTNCLTALFVVTINDGVSQLTEEMSTGGDERDVSILEDIDISGSDSWDPQDHEKDKDMLKEFIEICSKCDLDLGVTCLVEHEIKLKPEVVGPFKE